jgi:hypothetical protein
MCCSYMNSSTAKSGAGATKFHQQHVGRNHNTHISPASRGLRHKIKRLVVRVVLPTKQELCNKISCSQNSTYTPSSTRKAKATVRRQIYWSRIPCSQNSIPAKPLELHPTKTQQPRPFPMQYSPLTLFINLTAYEPSKPLGNCSCYCIRNEARYYNHCCNSLSTRVLTECYNTWKRDNTSGNRVELLTKESQNYGKRSSHVSPCRAKSATPLVPGRPYAIDGTSIGQLRKF